MFGTDFFFFCLFETYFKVNLLSNKHAKFQAAKLQKKISINSNAHYIQLLIITFKQIIFFFFESL